jgi:hypothetical protein
MASTNNNNNNDPNNDNPDDNPDSTNTESTISKTTPRKLWTSEEDDILYKSRTSGQHTWKETMELLPGRRGSAGHTHFRKLINKRIANNLPVPPRYHGNYVWTDEQDREMLRLYFDMKDEDEIARILRRSEGSVKKRRRDLQDGPLWNEIGEPYQRKK